MRRASESADFGDLAHGERFGVGLLKVDRGMLEAKTHEMRRRRRTDFAEDDREKSRRNAAVPGDFLHRYAGSRHPFDHDVLGIVAKLLVTTRTFVEPSLAKAAPLDKFQFLRHGYFCADTATTPEKPVFNLTVSLKDSWGKEQKKQG